MIELSLWLTHSTYSNAREERKEATTTTNLMCVNYTTFRWGKELRRVCSGEF